MTEDSQQCASSHDAYHPILDVWRWREHEDIGEPFSTVPGLWEVSLHSIEEVQIIVDNLPPCIFTEPSSGLEVTKQRFEFIHQTFTVLLDFFRLQFRILYYFFFIICWPNFCMFVMLKGQTWTLVFVNALFQMACWPAICPWKCIKTVNKVKTSFIYVL